MVDINQYYKSESDYLKADGLENGKQYPLTISGIEVTEFEDNGKKDQKLTCKFNESDKKLVLNKTNAQIIGAVLGFETDMWLGQQIKIYRTMVQFGDKMVDAIRVAMPLADASLNSTPPTAGMVDQSTPIKDDDIPF